MKTLEVIQEVRKKLNDYDRIECPLAVETLLESIRDTLDDREVSGEYNISDLIQELKDANGDTVEKGVFTDSEIILAEILDQLAVVFPVKDKIRIGRHFGEAGYRFKEKRILPITAITDA